MTEESKNMAEEPKKMTEELKNMAEEPKKMTEESKDIFFLTIPFYFLVNPLTF